MLVALVTTATAIVGLLLHFRSCSQTKPSLIAGWTGFRAALAFWIFSEHIAVQPVAGGGSFLLLSGAILAHTDKGTSTTYYGYAQFCLQRAFRIFPAYWVFEAFDINGAESWKDPMLLLKTFVTMPIQHPIRFFATQSWISHSDHPGNDHDHLWFVSTVVACYAAFPWINMCLKRLGTDCSLARCTLAAGCCYSMQLAEAFYIVHTSSDHNDWTYTHSVAGLPFSIYDHPIARLPQFVLGVLLAHMLKMPSVQPPVTSEEASDTSEGHAAKLTEGKGLMVSIFTDLSAVLIVGCAVAGQLANINEQGPIGLGSVASRMNLCTPLTIVLLFGLAYPDSNSFTKRLLSLPMVGLVGEASYGVYLWQMLVTGELGCKAVHGTSPKCSTLEISLAYCCTLLIGIMSLHVIEKPSQQVERWAVQRLFKRSRN
eukprot:TRINITY_DN12850_c0_g1_i2.p1 TRINITY_DN12850_c0_g1~~TRINITY_DN12850_c0_g1_i2.p1  ORF type:complete len:427 (+),score=40.82 TRINITY_DN12850_c0_g1_i2:350-1630(+)